jgi:hypothetical protein
MCTKSPLIYVDIYKCNHSENCKLLHMKIISYILGQSILVHIVFLCFTIAGAYIFVYQISFIFYRVLRCIYYTTSTFHDELIPISHYYSILMHGRDGN